MGFARLELDNATDHPFALGKAAPVDPFSEVAHEMKEACQDNDRQQSCDFVSGNPCENAMGNHAD
jgi:hypothetical protein